MKSNMKLLYIFAIILLANTYVKAQFNAGESYLGGSLMMNQSKFGESLDNHNSSIGLGYGKFISKNTAKTLSIYVGYGNQSSSSGFLDDKSFGISLNKGRQYYKTIFGKLGIYGGFSGGINYNNQDTKTPYNQEPMGYVERTANQIALSFDGGGGLVYRLNNKWAFTGNLINLDIADVSYSWADGKRNLTQSGVPSSFSEKRFEYNFKPTISFSFGIGIRYILK
ncbi:hypothetical protein VB776_21310 [Arcicella sp. DC2W]|uniref:Outer membrane protein beta-barrel domain-containing protein n=1 Tax=Arcicella gelida TaxID=2984195 RepID=A0ABU5SAH8_9BACT|nr:hypothetical protein [Arcicella sp. DC2W]MEA5405492.1 hypothetical protein [Arcicella sp. DC2W]